VKIDYSSRRDFADRFKERKAEGKLGWADEDSYKSKSARIEKFLARHIVPRNGRFLELGCGAGNITLFMAEKGFEAYGIDVVPEAITWAKEKIRESSASADFRLGNVVDLKSYSDRFFDFVFDGETLHCIIVPDRKSCLASVFRTLKPGGFFLAGANLVNEEISKRVDLGSGCCFDPQSQCLYRNGVPYYYLSREQEFLKEIREVGFQVVHFEETPKMPEYKLFQAGWLWVDAIKP
jgi:2-polyprenyl-3-methyl-5-hydroxy-6-metoxy-1,4-benzoquinol methylase